MKTFYSVLKKARTTNLIIATSRKFWEKETKILLTTSFSLLWQISFFNETENGKKTKKNQERKKVLCKNMY